MKRSRIPQKKSERMFTRTAQKVHRKNNAVVMRGGIRF